MLTCVVPKLYPLSFDHTVVKKEFAKVSTTQVSITTHFFFWSTSLTEWLGAQPLERNDALKARSEKNRL